QRSKIAESEAFAVKVWSELAIGHAPSDGNCVSCRIECYDAVHVLQRKELIFAVGNNVKAMARSEDFEFGLLVDEVLNLLKGANVEQLFGAVFNIAGPVFEAFSRSPRKTRGNKPSERADADLEEGSFVHGARQACKHRRR